MNLLITPSPILAFAVAAQVYRWADGVGVSYFGIQPVLGKKKGVRTRDSQPDFLASDTG
jgi:hypothetical protein